jgi:hypothetical protein
VIIEHLILALVLIGLIFAYFRNHPMFFTFLSIILVSILIFKLTDNYISLTLTIAGLIFAHHSVQPFFYPIATNYESKEKYITCMYKDEEICPFNYETDINTQNPIINYYLINEEIYTIKLPLFRIFNSIKIPFPATEKLDLDYCGITRYSTVPFISKPETKDNLLVLNLKTSAWTITEIKYPIRFSQKITEKPDVGFGSLSYYYPSLNEGNENVTDIYGEYGIYVSFRNNEKVSVNHAQFLSDMTVDSDFWQHYPDDTLQVSYENGDIIGIFKGSLYCRIINKIEPWERRTYYLSFNGTGKIYYY